VSGDRVEDEVDERGDVLGRILAEGQHPDGEAAARRLTDAAEVELGGIEPPSISRWTNPLRPFPTTRLTLPHRRVGWIV
jgi:hypothetical protein